MRLIANFLVLTIVAGYYIPKDEKVENIANNTSQPEDIDPTIPPPPSINYGSMIGMVVGVAVLFTCCTYGKYAFRAVKNKLEDNAGLPFPPVVYSQAYQASLQASSPKPTFSQSVSADLTVSSDTTDTTLPLLSPLKAGTTPTKPAPTPTKPAPTPTKPAPTPTKPAPTPTKLAPNPDLNATNSGSVPTGSGPKQIGSTRTPPMQPTHPPTTDPLEGAFSENETLVKCTTV